jgi:citrate lyase beta subunit
MLYAPASEPAKARRALDVTTGAVIFDLEDAVAPAARAAGRAWCAAALDQPASGPERWVRINDLAGDLWFEDLVAVARPGLAGIVAPKVESDLALACLDGALGALETDRHLPVQSISLIATIETPCGLARVDAIAGSSTRLTALGFGAGDFCHHVGIGYPPSDAGTACLLDRVRAELVLASARAGLHPPHDSAYGVLDDVAGLTAEAVRAREMGFGGKHAVHPRQVGPLAACFTATAEELRRAECVVAAYDEATAKGIGAIAVDGILVDEAIARIARSTLDTDRGTRARP